jgi:hypothetical protein
MNKRKVFREKRHVLRRQRYQLKRLKSSKTFDPNRIAVHSTRIERDDVVLEAPPVFNLKDENCVRVIKYVNQIHKSAAANKNVLVNLENVKDIREGAIAMLLSVMSDVRKRFGVRIHGNMPKDPMAKLVMEQSGFFKFVNRNDTLPVIPAHKNILRTGVRNTTMEFLGEDIKDAMNTVWKERGRNPLLWGGVFEMMRNSVDHAFPKAQKVRWHIAINHDDEKQLVKFSFVDNGKGIIKSMKKSLLRGAIHHFIDGADVLDTAFHDGIESRTGLPWRGKGLPFIFENYSEGIVKNFLVITNNVFIHYDSGIKRLLPVSFDGTYYYWEIDATCKKACFVP